MLLSTAKLDNTHVQGLTVPDPEVISCSEIYPAHKCLTFISKIILVFEF